MQVHDKLEQGMYGCWLLWNNCLHNFTCTASVKIYDMSARLKDEFTATLMRPNLNVQDRRRCWTPPPRNKYKINVDAGFSYSSRIGDLEEGRLFDSFFDCC